MATPGVTTGRGASGEARPRRCAQHRRCAVDGRGLRVPAHKSCFSNSLPYLGNPRHTRALTPRRNAEAAAHGSHGAYRREAQGLETTARDGIHYSAILMHSWQGQDRWRIGTSGGRPYQELIWFMYWPGREVGEAPAAPQLRLMLSRSCCCSACMC